MKRAISILLAALMCLSACAFADAPQLSNSLFGSAKQAVGCLASGEYERLVTLLPFSDVAPSASEWKSFARNYSNLSNPQSDYAVAYWTGSVWKLAVPIQEPSGDSVEVLLLTSEDGSAFSGYRYATWGQVVSEYSGSDRVTWNQEYVGASPQVFAD